MATTRQVRAAQGAPRYTADDWENDPFLNPSPQRAEQVAAEAFATLRSLQVPPEQVTDPETRAKYQEYLAQQQ